MSERGDKLKSAVGTFATWTLLAIMFSGSFLVAVIFGLGGLLLWAATVAEPREDLLIRAGGFFVMALSVLLEGGSWLARFLMLSLAGIGLAYIVTYVTFRFTGSDFLERYFLVFVASVVMAAFMTTYPNKSQALLAVFYLLVAAAIVYLTYLPITYVSVRLKNSNIDPLPPIELPIKEDIYSKDLWHAIRAFVEKGDKAPLLVFILRHSPRNVMDVHLERAIRPVVEYQPRVSPLAPPWLEEKKNREEIFRREEIVRDLLKFIESAGGLE